MKKFIAKYIGKACSILLEFVASEMSNAKRSLQYDIKAKVEDIEMCITQNVINPVTEPSPRDILEIPLPIETLEDFLKFDASISLHQPDEDKKLQAFEKRKALVI